MVSNSEPSQNFELVMFVFLLQYLTFKRAYKKLDYNFIISNNDVNDYAQI